MPAGAESRLPLSGGTGIKSPSVLMEINVEVCEPLSAATRRGLSNKLCAERESSPQL